MHFSALIPAARDAVLEAPSSFYSIRFPGHSENLFISSLSSLYISSFLPHPPLTAVQISTTDTNTQTCVLIFFFFLFIFRLDFISVSFRNDVLFNLVLCFGVSIPSLVDMSILYFG